MTIHVFCGPSLPAADVHAELDAVVSGPVAFGDVTRAVRQKPVAIAIVDGYFEGVPAVWHKEILWAMHAGVHVFGASSMGALRAAELAEFGMVGVGAVYEAFRRGELEDDDEVAVAHGSAEDGYPLLSDAMVNIRVTVRRAREASVLGERTAAALLRIAKGRYYAERSYAALLSDAKAEGLDATDLRSFVEWLPRGRVDQKRADALHLVRTLRDWQRSTPAPKRVDYRFEPTDAWHEGTRIALSQPSAREGSALALGGALEEELKLTGKYPTAFNGAAARGAAVELALRASLRPDGSARRAALEDFRRARGLLERKAFDAWAIDQRLESADLPRFFDAEALLAWARPATEAFARSQLADYLRAAGEYGPLATRAERKRDLLRAAGWATPSLYDVGMSEAEIWEWFFARRGERVPPDVDSAARRMGFCGRDELRAAVLREVWYARQDHEPDATAAR